MEGYLLGFEIYPICASIRLPRIRVLLLIAVSIQIACAIIYLLYRSRSRIVMIMQDCQWQSSPNRNFCSTGTTHHYPYRLSREVQHLHEDSCRWRFQSHTTTAVEPG
ncbi:hypothetical protein L227DRAFT_105435 [Lentinus tigrinus ALCF2SS1-6]|uniref:Uncharacterized protein n=1 Tax=Lentinus tigrinus ALCF2SS1-6 TaxID=1328759 RepID=A0A5C2S8E3_9APHY|nr:hypothetical protein L227DRAFT_105435 [Lentinus tigrinus ALCF2SS1-6]